MPGREEVPESMVEKLWLADRRDDMRREIVAIRIQERLRIRFAMAETPQPWTSVDLDAALGALEAD